MPINEVSEYRCPECNSRLVYKGLRVGFSTIALPLHVYVCSSRDDGEKGCPVVIGSHQEDPTYGYYFLNEKLPSNEIRELLGEELEIATIRAGKIFDLRLAVEHISRLWPEKDIVFDRRLHAFLDENGNIVAKLDRNTCRHVEYQGHIWIGPLDDVRDLLTHCNAITRIIPPERYKHEGLTPLISLGQS